MESRRQVSYSSGSTTADIFGTKKSSSPSSSARTLNSIFPQPQPQMEGMTNVSDIVGCSKSTSGNQAWSSSKQGKKAHKDVSVYPEDRGQPCHLSSSLYYGGQDVYSNSPNNQNQGSGSYPIFNKEGEEDDSNGTSASRGNWWRGSLYY